MYVEHLLASVAHFLNHPSLYNSACALIHEVVSNLDCEFSTKFLSVISYRIIRQNL